MWLKIKVRTFFIKNVILKAQKNTSNYMDISVQSPKKQFHYRNEDFENTLFS